jgi:hypothetical protein
LVRRKLDDGATDNADSDQRRDEVWRHTVSVRQRAPEQVRQLVNTDSKVVRMDDYPLDLSKQEPQKLFSRAVREFRSLGVDNAHSGELEDEDTIEMSSCVAGWFADGAVGAV